jgi:hypothetical protein
MVNPADRSANTVQAMLFGPGLTADELTAISRWTGLPPGSGGGPRAVILAPDDDPDGLSRLLRDGPLALVELTAGVRFPAAGLHASLKQSGLYVSLSTRTAWSLDTASILCDALTQRQMLSSTLRHDVELSLHEATINALLHGNLELGMSLVEDSAAFDEFCRHLSNRLDEPERARKRIEFEAWLEDGVLLIRVTDEGPGYDPSSLVATELTAKHGRGLSIMRTLAVDVGVADGGRTVILRYG